MNSCFVSNEVFKVRIGDYVRVEVVSMSYVRFGHVVHIIPKGVTPQEALVDKYYGDSAPRASYRASIHDRLVVDKDCGSYVICPVGAPNMHITVEN